MDEQATNHTVDWMPLQVSGAVWEASQAHLWPDVQP